MIIHSINGVISTYNWYRAITVIKYDMFRYVSFGSLLQ